MMQIKELDGNITEFAQEETGHARANVAEFAQGGGQACGNVAEFAQGARHACGNIAEFAQDPLSLPSGPITRLRAKCFKKAPNEL